MSSYPTKLTKNTTYCSKRETRNKALVEETKCHKCDGWNSIDDCKNVIQFEWPLSWFVM